MIMADRLHGALAAEHAAIFGYGIAGARLDGPLLEAARQAETAHRARRDALLALGAGGTPPPAEAAYALPFPVTDAPSALRLAVHLEERSAAAWRYALGATQRPASTGPSPSPTATPTGGDLRRLALDALVASAVLATRWRIAAGMNPTTVPLP